MSAPRVCVFTLPIQGHTAPLLPVVRELVGWGAAVDVFTSAAWSGPVAAAGATVVEYPPVVAAEAADPSSNFLVVAAVLGELATGPLLDWSVGALRAANPDVVVVDSMAPWGRLAAEVLGLPVVTSTSSFVIHGGLGATPQAALDVLVRLPEGARALAAVGAARWRLARRGVRHGLGGPLRLLSNRGERTVVYTSRELQPGAGRLDSTVQFVGSTLDGDDRPVDEAGRALLAELAGERLVYVSLGTLYNDRAPFLRACVEALSGTGRAVVVATGERVDPAALGPLPPGVHLIRFAPQLPLLAQADLFVTHGGLNSAHEALWHGVPMVCFPQAADQPVVSDRLQRLGVARVLRGREPGAAQIRAAAAALLATDAAAARSRSLGEGLRVGGGAAAAADAVLEVGAGA